MSDYIVVLIACANINDIDVTFLFHLTFDNQMFRNSSEESIKCVKPRLKKKSYPCGRRVPVEPYSRFAAETYWNQIFGELSDEVSIPHFKRREYVKRILEQKTYEDIEGVLQLVDFGLPEVDPEKSKITVKSGGSIVSADTWTSRSSRDSFRKISFGPEFFKDFKEGKEAKGSKKAISYNEESICSQTKPSTPTDYIKNPYINFLNKDPVDARIWLEKPVPNFMSKPLVEKSKRITDQIVDEFYDWFKTIGDDDGQGQVNKKNLTSLFDVTSNEFAKKAMCVSMKELASVPLAVALARHIPEKYERAMLRQNLMQDILAEKGKPKLHAFSTSLPPGLEFKPPANNTFNRWIYCKGIRQDLKSMEYVWKDIHHISSVRAFCEWLYFNPKLERPRYLVDLNLISRENIEHRPSVDTRDSILFSEAMLKQMGKNKSDIQLHLARTSGDHIKTQTYP